MYSTTRRKMKTLEKGNSDCDALVTESVRIKKPNRFWLNCEISFISQLRSGLPNKVNGDILLFTVMKRAVKQSAVRLVPEFKLAFGGSGRIRVRFFDSAYINVKGLEQAMHYLLSRIHRRRSPIENAIALGVFTLAFILSCVYVLAFEPPPDMIDKLIMGNLSILLWLGVRLLYKRKTTNQYGYSSEG